MSENDEPTVPVSDLRGLINFQRSREDKYETFNDEQMGGLAKGYGQCANQLEELVEEYE
jgi:hypothetical protein